MAIWYFDSVNGSDSNGGHSANDAKQNYNPSGTAAGDTFLFKRGATQVVTTALQWVQNGSLRRNARDMAHMGKLKFPIRSGSMVRQAET